MNMLISALNVHESPEVPHHIGNRGQGTWRWHQISDWSRRMRLEKYAI